MAVMVGPFGPPLRILWLKGIVDFHFKKVFNLVVGVWGPLKVDHWVSWLHSLLAHSGFLSFNYETLIFSHGHFIHPPGPSVSGSLLSLTLFLQRKASSIPSHFHALSRA